MYINKFMWCCQALVGGRPRRTMLMRVGKFCCVLGVGLIVWGRMGMGGAVEQVAPINPGLPDLTVLVDKLTQKSGIAGDTVRLTLQLRSQGALLRPSAKFVIAYWRSVDMSVGAGDQLLQRETVRADVFAESTSIKLKRKLRDVPPMGGQFLIIRVDAENEVAEGENEVNNQVVRFVPNRGCRKEVWRSEREPSSVENPQHVGALKTDTCVMIAGTLETNEDIDGFVMKVRETMPLLVTVTQAPSPSVIDFDLAITDLHTNKILAICDRPFSPSVCPVTVNADMVVLITVLPTRGQGGYALDVTPVIGEIVSDLDIDTTSTPSAEPAPSPSDAASSVRLTVRRTGGGTVTSAVPGINCGTDCTEFYSTLIAVPVISLTATPDDGSIFFGWSVSGCVTRTCVFMLRGDATVTARFVPAPVIIPSGPTTLLTIMTSGTGKGVVKSLESQHGIDCGTDCSEFYSIFLQSPVVILDASPLPGSVFRGWSGDDCENEITFRCSVLMNMDKTVTARFEMAPSEVPDGPTALLTVATSGDGEGVVTTSSPGIDCGIDCTQVYLLGETLTLTARSFVGSRFEGWVGGGCENVAVPECRVLMTTDKTITALFKGL